MKALHPKKFISEKFISEAAIKVQSQMKSCPSVTNSTSKGQELPNTPTSIYLAVPKIKLSTTSSLASQLCLVRHPDISVPFYCVHQ